jgi:hypothetical protein
MLLRLASLIHIIYCIYMDFETAMRDLLLFDALPSRDTSADVPEEWRNRWYESEQDFSLKEQDFLSPSKINEYADKLELPLEILDAFLQSASLFRDLPAARRLAVHCRYLLYGSRPGNRPNTAAWPMIPQEVHPSSEMFYAQVFLSALPHAVALAAEREIEEEIVLHTLQDIQIWIEDHRNKTGRWGLSQRGWFAFHFSGELYQLGRLQFQPANFHHDFHFHRGRKDGRVIALAGSGMVFREDGQCIDADLKSWSQTQTQGQTDPKPELKKSWTATYRRDRKKVFGYPVSPEGRALGKPLSLETDEWPEVLKKDDPVLAVHIPAAGPLDPEACSSSYRRAFPFFKRAFPRLSPKAFTCTSWLMDNQLTLDYLSREIPPESNIPRFLRGYYLLPLPGTTDSQTLERIFNGKTINDLETAPQQTGLQRAITRRMKTGGRWRMAIGVIFPEDLGRAREGLIRRYPEEELQ